VILRQIRANFEKNKVAVRLLPSRTFSLIPRDQVCHVPDSSISVISARPIVFS
jgi:hypothetical protein